MYRHFVSYLLKNFVRLNMRGKSLKRRYSCNDTVETQLEESITDKVRVKRKNHAILMMYCGWGYYGMLRCPDLPTIEGELLKALLSCGQLDELSSEEYYKVNFQRASKTDKSVSAFGQVCSMKELLVDEIQCWSYRATAERITFANELFQKYKGTHNFYNFTSRRAPDDKSCNRYIMSIQCLPTVLLGEHEYIVVQLTGQSFMLHQIRKMVGLVLGILQGYTTENVFDMVFTTERFDVPIAPGLGLMLNQVAYDQYNLRFKNDGFHQPIDWENYKNHRDLFKMQYIYKHIDEIEVENKSMYTWLHNLNKHSFSYRDYSAPSANGNAEESKEKII